MSALLSLPETGHRERLLAGMATAVRERRVDSVTVAEVVANARTSRRTFYEHFADRDACFLALFDVVTERLLATVADAAGIAVADREHAFGERIASVLDAYVSALTTDPCLARACIRDTPVLGPPGLERMRAVDRRWAELLVALSAERAAWDPTVRELPLEVAIVITGGFRDVTARALDEGWDPERLRAIGVDTFRRLASA